MIVIYDERPRPLWVKQKKVDLIWKYENYDVKGCNKYIPKCIMSRQHSCIICDISAIFLSKTTLPASQKSDSKHELTIYFWNIFSRV